MNNLSFDIHTIIAKYVNNESYKKIIRTCKILNNYYGTDEIIDIVNKDINMFIIDNINAIKLINILEVINRIVYHIQVIFANKGLQLIAFNQNRDKLMVFKFHTSNL